MNKFFKETPGQFYQRIKSGGTRKPLRSFKELCEELGVDMNSVSGKLKLEGAPKPVLKIDGTRGHTSWYKPEEFKAWWAKQTPAVKPPPTRHCDECVHMLFYHGSEKDYHCTKGHKPRWYQPKREGDMDYGFKRRCEDFEGEFK